MEKTTGRRRQQSIQLLLLLLLGLASVSQASDTCDSADSEESPVCGAGGVQMFVSKRGGAIRIYRAAPEPEVKSGGDGEKKGGAGGGGGGKRKRTGQITIFIDSVAEVDSGGKPIAKRVIEQYNKATFSEPLKKSVTLPNTDGVTADCLETNAVTKVEDVDNTAKLVVCLITKNGTLTMDDETSTLVEGHIKFSVSMTWSTWSANGAFLEVDVNFKIPPGRAVNKAGKEKKKPAKFSLGEDAAADFSGKAYLDKKAWSTMPDGFPTFVQKGANNIVTLRVPKFNSSFEYDPTVDCGRSYTDMDSGSNSRGAFIFLVCACAVFSLVAVSDAAVFGVDGLLLH